MIHVLQAAIVGWLPGAVLFRAPFADRDRRATLDAEERLFWAVFLSVAISVTGAFLLAVLGRYSFERLLVADLILAIVIAAASRFRLRFRGARWPGVSALIPIALLLLAAWRFFPPAEYIIGGKDPGTYVNEGVQIAQRGTIFYSDPVVSSVPPFARDLFFPRHEEAAEYGVRFMGFFITDPDTGGVVGQFPHLLPASIAIGYGLAGLNGALWTVGTWATLGLLAFYFATARLAGKTTAAAAAALLALHVVEVWFSRYPNAEVVMQALLFGALLANARAHVDGDRFFAPVAAVLAVLLLILRFDAVLAIAALSAGVLLGTFAHQRIRLSFVLVLVAGTIGAVWYLSTAMHIYMQMPLAYLRTLGLWRQLLLILATAGAAALAVAAPRWPALRTRVVAWAPAAVSVVLIAAAVYGYVFRHAGGLLAPHDANALRTFTNSYLTLPALIAALIGIPVLARRAFWRDPAYFVTFAIFALFFFYKIRIVPEQFWMTRRFLPVVLPGILAFAAAAALSGARGSWRGARPLRLVIGVIFVAVLAGQYIRASEPVVRHREYSGLVAHVERLASTIGRNDLVIAESRNAGGDMHVIALPLAYIYDRQVLVLHSPRPDKSTFAQFLMWAQTKYDRVLFLGGSGSDLLSYRYGVQALSSTRFQVPEYEAPLNAYPRGPRRKEFDFGLYRFTDPPAATATWFDLDVGHDDDLHVLRFHAKESSEGRSVRWSRATSYISVTTLHPAAREVTLLMSSGGRPAAAGSPRVEVYLHGQLLGAIGVEAPGFNPYSLPIPRDLAARAAALQDPVELKLVSSLWNPHDVLGSGDDRDLGVMIDRVTVR